MLTLGASEGIELGAALGLVLGDELGASLGTILGAVDGLEDGELVGLGPVVSTTMRLTIGFLFSDTKSTTKSPLLFAVNCFVIM